MRADRSLFGLLGLCALATVPAMLDPYYLLAAYPALALGAFAALARSLSGSRPLDGRGARLLAPAAASLFVLGPLAKKLGLGPELAAPCQAASYAIGGFVASSIYVADSSSNKEARAPRLAGCIALCSRGLVLPLGIVAGYGIAATDCFAFVGPMPRALVVVAPWLALSLAGCAISAMRLAKAREERFLAATCLQGVTLILLISFIVYGNSPFIGRAVSLCSIVAFAVEIFADAPEALGCREPEGKLVAVAVDLCLTAVFLAANELRGLGLYPFAGQPYPASSLVWALVALCAAAHLIAAAPRQTVRESSGELADAPRPITRVDGLSARENEVLDCLARGLTVAQTAAELSISPGSVGTYRSRVYKKLGVRSAQELRARTVYLPTRESGRAPGASHINASQQSRPRIILLFCGALALAAYHGLPSLTMAAERTGLDGMRVLVAAGAIVGMLIDASDWGLSRRTARCLDVSAGAAGLLLCLLVEELQYPAIAFSLDHAWLLPLAAGVALGFAAGNISGHVSNGSGGPLEGPTYLVLGALGAAFFLARAAVAGAYLVGWEGRVCGAAALAGAIGVIQYQTSSRMQLQHKLILVCSLVGMFLGEGLLSTAIVPLCWESLAINGAIGVILAVWTAVAIKRFQHAREALQDEAGKQSVQDLMNALALSPAERRVCELLLQGAGVPGIAERLVVSRNTVATQKKAIYRKAGVHSQAELIRLFLGRGGANGASRGR